MKATIRINPIAASDLQEIKNYITKEIIWNCLNKILGTLGNNQVFFVTYAFVYEY